MKRELKKVLMKALVYGGKPTMLFFETDIDKILDRTAQAILEAGYHKHKKAGDK